ncbi:MAG: hypothetical protein O7G85_05870 [Planctomycetota bacterium]|nr:hypothetical protein [Planctomycetota bacterium]
MNASSFLPEDYLAKKAERRTNIISLTLFVVVIFAVIGAFLVTNRQWKSVEQQVAKINNAYLQAGEQLQELSELEQQKDEMMRKAEIVAAIVEPVPRSILLAELINRMPERLGLLEFELKSSLVKVVRTAGPRPAATGRHNKGPTRGLTRQQAADQIQKVEAPKFEVKMVLKGMAPTDLEVSRYLAALNAYSLLDNVTLEYSEEKEFDGQMMREFKIKMKLRPDADVRHVDPLLMPRNPMSDEIRMGRPVVATGISGTPDQEN